MTPSDDVPGGATWEERIDKALEVLDFTEEEIAEACGPGHGGMDVPAGADQGCIRCEHGRYSCDCPDPEEQRRMDRDFLARPSAGADASTGGAEADVCDLCHEFGGHAEWCFVVEHEEIVTQLKADLAAANRKISELRKERDSALALLRAKEAAL